MIYKELREARWKILIAGFIVLFSALVVPFLYPIMQELSTSEDILGSEKNFIGNQWFGQNILSILGFLAIILGASQIAGEVRNNTIHFLLSRPLSRRSVFFAKYLSSSFILIGLYIASTVIIFITARIQGVNLVPQAVFGATLGGISGILYIFGLALMFSTIFDESLRAASVTLIVLIALSWGPELFFGTRWNIANYWFDVYAYEQGSIAWSGIVISAISASIPVGLALYLFERRSY